MRDTLQFASEVQNIISRRIEESVKLKAQRYKRCKELDISPYTDAVYVSMCTQIRGLQATSLEIEMVLQEYMQRSGGDVV